MIELLHDYSDMGAISSQFEGSFRAERLGVEVVSSRF